MGLSQKKKSNLVIVLALLVIVIIAGAFLFWPEKQESGPPVFEKHVDDFVIDGNVITNEKEGLKVIIPEGWTAEKEEQIYSYVWGVSIFSPDIDIEFRDPPDSHILNRGCAISVNIEQSENIYNYTREILNNINENRNNDEFFLDNEEDIGIVIINERPFLREGVINGGLVWLRVLLKNNKMIYFSLISPKNKGDLCLEKFNKFLEDVEIRE